MHQQMQGVQFAGKINDAGQRGTSFRQKFKMMYPAQPARDIISPKIQNDVFRSACEGHHIVENTK
jgi:hypothetical protein